MLVFLWAKATKCKAAVPYLPLSSKHMTESPMRWALQWIKIQIFRNTFKNQASYWPQLFKTFLNAPELSHYVFHSASWLSPASGWKTAWHKAARRLLKLIANFLSRPLGESDKGLTLPLKTRLCRCIQLFCVKATSKSWIKLLPQPMYLTISWSKGNGLRKVCGLQRRRKTM